MVAQGHFRQDLYYRLAVVKIEVPSLNQRRDDIIPIAKHFLVEFNQKFDKHFTGISADAETALKQFNWTGNVRELKNLIEKGVLLGDGTELTPHDLGLEGVPKGFASENGDYNFELPSISPSGIDFPAILKSLEMTYFKKALQLAGGNESKAAEILNLSRDKFRYRRHKIEK